MSLYVYCLGDELSEGCFAGVAGVGRACVRVLRLGRLAAVVSDAEGAAAALTDENVLAHNRVNAAALAVSTPLPFRFGARATPERLAEYASANEAALLEGLARVRGCVEMSVKLMRKSEGVEQAADEGKAAGVATSGGGRGTAFLMSKRRELLGEEEERRCAESAAAWLAAGVSGLVRETAARLSPSEKIAVRAAHLVERSRVGEYRERVRSLGAGRADLRLLASGPWPPYSFADIRVQR
jgi:hypothetical protein